MQHGWLDNPMLGNRKREPFCKAAAWAWLIDHACYKATPANVNGKIIELRRGQIAASVRFLAEAWGWSTTRVFRCLRSFQDAGAITCSTETGQIVVTVCNYDKYQSPQVLRMNGSETASEQERNDSGTNLKEGNEVKEEEIPDSPHGESDRETVSDGLGVKGELWGRCLNWLSAHSDNKNPRSTIGKWIKRHGELAVLDAFDTAMKKDPVDPISYITALLSKPPPQLRFRTPMHESGIPGYVPMNGGPGG